VCAEEEGVARTTRLMVSSGVVVGKLARAKMASALPLASPTENDVPLRMRAHGQRSAPSLGKEHPTHSHSQTNKSIEMHKEEDLMEDGSGGDTTATYPASTPAKTCSLTGTSICREERGREWLCVCRGRAWGVGWVLSDKQYPTSQHYPP
jgi:hypothetical protein